MPTLNEFRELLMPGAGRRARTDEVVETEFHCLIQENPGQLVNALELVNRYRPNLARKIEADLLEVAEDAFD